MPSETRSIVKTTLPAYQKERWVRQADRFGMSQSEFVRTMVQAGVHWFDIAQTQSPGVNPRGNGLEDRVLAVLPSDGDLTFDEIADSLNENFESRLDATIRSLEDDGRVAISPRGGISLQGGARGHD